MGGQRPFAFLKAREKFVGPPLSYERRTLQIDGAVFSYFQSGLGSVELIPQYEITTCHLLKTNVATDVGLEQSGRLSFSIGITQPSLRAIQKLAERHGEKFAQPSLRRARLTLKTALADLSAEQEYEIYGPVVARLDAELCTIVERVADWPSLLAPRLWIPAGGEWHAANLALARGVSLHVTGRRGNVFSSYYPPETLRQVFETLRPRYMSARDDSTRRDTFRRVLVAYSRSPTEVDRLSLKYFGIEAKDAVLRMAEHAQLETSDGVDWAPCGTFLSQPVDIFGPRNLPLALLPADCEMPLDLFKRYTAPGYRDLFNKSSTRRAVVRCLTISHSGESRDSMTFQPAGAKDTGLDF